MDQFPACHGHLGTRVCHARPGHNPGVDLGEGRLELHVPLVQSVTDESIMGRDRGFFLGSPFTGHGEGGEVIGSCLHGFCL